MLSIYSLLLICTILALGVHSSICRKSINGIGTNYCLYYGSFLLFLLIALLVWFAGLRTEMNDTLTYISNYKYRIPNSIDGLTQVDWSIGANPLFSIYQIMLKTIISPNGQVFIFVTAAITLISMVRFIFKYSEDFTFSMYFFMAFTVYAFTMAAMKQSLATAIAIWAMPEFVKGKAFKGLLIIFIAALIHPYVILFASALFLAKKGVWNRRIVLMIIGTVVVSIFFNRIMEGIVSITEIIGDEYELEWFAAGSGVGQLRIIAYLIPSILSFLSRNELKKTYDPLQHLFVNMTIIASCLSFLSGFGGSVLLGRIPNYFDVFICLSFPFILNHLSHRLNRMRIIIKPMMIVAYLVFYIAYYNKYFSLVDNPWTADIYARTSVFTLFHR